MALVRVLALLVLWRVLYAVIDPSPRVVQSAVKRCIVSLITLDAAVCLAFHGTSGPGVPWVLLILLLLVPTMFLGQWIYST